MAITLSQVYNNETYKVTFGLSVESSDTITKTAIIKWTVSCSNTSSSLYHPADITAMIDDEVVFSKKSNYGASGSGTFEYQFTPLNSQGHTFNITLKGSQYNEEEQTVTGRHTVSIVSGARIEAFPTFYDYENPTFTYQIHSAREDVVGVELASSYFDTKIIPIPANSKENATYTIEFTSEERKKMRETIFTSENIITTTKGQGAYTRFYLITRYSDGTASTNDVNGQPFCYLSRNIPNFSPTIVDTSATAIALTGDKNTLVRYISKAQVTLNIETSYGVVLTDYGVTHGSYTYMNQDVVNVNPVESDTFFFYATDSNGLTGTETVVVPLVEYVKLSCNLKSGAITGTGTFDVNVSGKFFNDSFGVVDNELFVYYRYKQVDGEYSDWVRITNVTYNNDAMTYTATATVTGLDYLDSYVFEAYAADVIDTVHSAERSIMSLPVFDWSKTDFNFNVPVTIKGKSLGENRILWQGNDVMLADTSIELSEPISNQLSGVVLIFSNASGDDSWSTHYIPKELVKFYNGGGHTFLMAVNAGLSNFGAKSLYISDEIIVGDDKNSGYGGSQSNITYYNKNYVLRYVIGV